MRPALDCGCVLSFGVSGPIVLLCVRQVFVEWRRERSAEVELADGAMTDAPRLRTDAGALTRPQHTPSSKQNPIFINKPAAGYDTD